MAVGMVSVAAAAAGAPTWLLAGLAIPVGLGASLAVPTLTALLVGSVPAERAGIASGVLNTCRQLGVRSPSRSSVRWSRNGSASYPVSRSAW
jgi:DHA2 family methylenomycin A resistance protein-like MFS transporter